MWSDERVTSREYVQWLQAKADECVLNHADVGVGGTATDEQARLDAFAAHWKKAYSNMDAMHIAGTLQAASMYEEVEG